MKMRPLALLTALASMLIGGCIRGGNDAPADTTLPANVSADPIKAVPDKDRYKVTAETTGLFKFSPLQAQGSDVDLKRGTHVIVLQHGRGFCQVKTPENVIGYVGTDDIAPLTATEIAQEDNATLEQAAAAAGGASLPFQQATAAAGGSQPVPSPTPSGKKGAKVKAASPGVNIPSDAGRNEQLPEPDAKPKLKPKATPTPTPSSNNRT